MHVVEFTYFGTIHPTVSLVAIAEQFHLGLWGAPCNKRNKAIDKFNAALTTFLDSLFFFFLSDNEAENRGLFYNLFWLFDQFFSFSTTIPYWVILISPFFSQSFVIPGYLPFLRPFLTLFLSPEYLLRILFPKSYDVHLDRRITLVPSYSCEAFDEKPLHYRKSIFLHSLRHKEKFSQLF